MKALFVVTTKDLPMSGFSLVNEKYAKQVGDLLRSTILDHDDESAVETYLHNYKHNSLKESTRAFLNECKLFPILKRIVGDYGIYVAPCLSKDEAGYGDEASHDFVGKLVDIAKADVYEELNCEPKEIYVVAHESDLTFALDKPDFFSQDKCLSESLKRLPDGHIYIFWHELKFRIYKDFILKLADTNDSAVIDACENALDFFEA